MGASTTYVNTVNTNWNDNDSNIDLSFIPNNMTYSINAAPSTNIYTTMGTNGTSWTNNTNYTVGSGGGYGNVNINNNGIDMADGTDIKIDGKSLKEFMNKMEERLAILVPDPKKMEKFAALKKAYEHYKLMEKLCQEDPVDESSI